MNLNDKRALVTGGSWGIGAAIVKRLAREGAHVALTYVSQPDQANATVQAAQAFGVQALAIQADSADAKAVLAAVERTVAELGGLDILVNNAGIGVMAPIDDYRLEGFDRTVAVNVRAVFVAWQAAVTHMPPGGRVITIGSCNAERMPFEGGAVYGVCSGYVYISCTAYTRLSRASSYVELAPIPLISPCNTGFSRLSYST